MNSLEIVTLTIDGQEVSVPQNTTLLEAARLAGIEIPLICQHEATTANGLCRFCVVDINHGRLLQPACIVRCQEGMFVETRNERVERARRTILEMLSASVDLSQSPEIQQLMDEYDVDRARFPAAKEREAPVYDDNPFYMRDYHQCILCWRCVQVCTYDAQYTHALTLSKRGFETRVSTAFNVPMPESTCVFCGQCTSVCPTGALKPKIEYGLEQGWSLEELSQNTGKRLKRRNHSG